MIKTILILYDKNQSSWCVVHDTKQAAVDIKQGDLSLITKISEEKRVIVLLGGCQCSFFLVDLPSSNQSKAISTIPYQLEETLSEDIEHLHFFYQRKPKDNKIGVVVINKKILKSITEELRFNGINPSYICPAFSLLESGTVCIDNDLAICNINQQNQFTCQKDLLPAMLETIDVDIKTLNVNCSKGEIEDYAHHHPLELLSKNIKNLPFNLLQKKVKRVSKKELIKTWGLTASLFVILLISYLFSMHLTINKLEKQISDSRQKSIKILKKAFPEIKKVSNPRILMKSKLKKLTQGRTEKQGNLTKLIFDVGSILKDSPNISINLINAHSNKLELDIKVSQLKEIEDIKEALINKSELTAKVSDISQNESGAKGRLIIK